MNDTVRAASNSQALGKTAEPAPPCTMVIFGANGDLTKRLLMPALYNLSGSKLLDDKFSNPGGRPGCKHGRGVPRAGSRR